MTTLIIILLTIVALGIIWVVIKNIIDKGSDEIALTGLTLDLDITKAVREGDELSVTVRRNPGKGNLVGINFVISDGDNSVVVRRDTTLSELGWETFIFDTNTLAVGKITSIAVAPIYKTSSGNEITGRALDTVNYKDELGSGNPSYTGSPGGGGGDGGNGGGGGDGGDGGEECDPTCTVGEDCIEGVCVEECIPIQTCENQGFNCNTFIDDCLNTINCDVIMGGCSGTDICTNNICVSDDCIPLDNATACTNAEFECGILVNNETCGVGVDCSVEFGTCSEQHSGEPNWECQSNMCIEIIAVNSGTVLNSWPPLTGLYFDAVNLPTDLPGTGYSGYWVAFPLVDDTQCFEIVGYVQDTDVYEYAIAEVSVYFNALPINAGDAYYIWGTQMDCILYTPWPL